MNYLAHFYLSNYDEGLIVGNYIADDLRGKSYLDSPPHIQKGILLHRKIDTFTDTHETVSKSITRIREEQKKFSPVVMDVFYDYFLAKNWSSFSKDELFDFTKLIYKTLFNNFAHLPKRSQLKLPFMARSNWLYNYRQIGGIKKTLSGLSKRTNYKNNMHRAHRLLEKNHDELEQDFNVFFPDLKKFVTNELDML